MVRHDSLSGSGTGVDMVARRQGDRLGCTHRDHQPVHQRLANHQRHGTGQILDWEQPSTPPYPPARPVAHGQQAADQQTTRTTITNSDPGRGRTPAIDPCARTPSRTELTDTAATRTGSGEAVRGSDSIGAA